MAPLMEQIKIIHFTDGLTDTNQEGMTSVHADDPVNPGQVVQGVLKQNQVHGGLVIVVLLQDLRYAKTKLSHR